ncbi:MAG: tRNA adenosine(34) deaminase TadA [Nitrospirae bacterium]|nr:MAG: tRNA adenosine(34) deaminase TadA [Nitrospirota bacterium]
MNTDAEFMRVALEEAKKAEEEGEVPVGAVVVIDGEVVAREHNRREQLQDPTAHAEVLALKKAAQYKGQWRLLEATLYVTKEPCPMCAGAIVNARIKRLVYGCPDEKAGSAGTLYNIVSDPRLNHRVEVTPGVLAEECRTILRSFFEKKRQ